MVRYMVVRRLSHIVILVLLIRKLNFIRISLLRMDIFAIKIITITIIIMYIIPHKFIKLVLIQCRTR